MDLRANILLVEDDPNLGLVTKENLIDEGFHVTLVDNGQRGIDAFRAGKYDLCIVDVMMPIKDGFSLAEEIRMVSESVPIIFLTAKSLSEDKIKGFKLGADDYVTKPFDFREFVLRIEAVLKRHFRAEKNAQGPKDLFEVGDTKFDFNNLTLETPVSQRSLTPKEGAILRLLCLNADQLLTREMALKIIYGKDDYFKGRSMDVFISKLRKYLKEDPKLKIENIHGAGFKLSIIS